MESYEVMLQSWLRKEVLTSFLDSCREAISRNAKMFRKDDEQADNVLEVCRWLKKPGDDVGEEMTHSYVPFCLYVVAELGHDKQMLSVVHKFLATSVLLPSLSAASNIAQLPTAGPPPPPFYQVRRSTLT